MDCFPRIKSGVAMTVFVLSFRRRLEFIVPLVSIVYILTTETQRSQRIIKKPVMPALCGHLVRNFNTEYTKHTEIPNPYRIR